MEWPLVRRTESNTDRILKLVHHLAGHTSNEARQLAYDHNSGERPQLLEVDKWATSRYVPELAQIVGYRPYPLDELLLMAAAFDYHRPMWSLT